MDNCKIECRGVPVTVSDDGFTVSEGEMQGAKFKTYDQLDKAIYDAENSSYYDSIKYVKQSDLLYDALFDLVAIIVMGCMAYTALQSFFK